jgi:hypothetical protein
MLIKLQKTRFSPEYFIIENARNVSYRDEPLRFTSEDEVLSSMQDFMARPETGTPSRLSCWYQMEEDGSGHEGYDLEFAEGYAVNEISFVNSTGEWECIRFDGEAFICNDDGKTIHRLKVGGFPSVFRPIRSTDDKRPLAPEAA